MLRNRDGARVKAGAPSQRQLRVAEEIRHVLSGILLRTEFRDPDLAGERLTVTEVRLSPDMRHATAFVVRLGRSDVDALLPAMKRAAAFLRAEMAKELRNLRVIPDLSFAADTSLDYAQHIDEVMRSEDVKRDLGK